MSGNGRTSLETPCQGPLCCKAIDNNKVEQEGVLQVHPVCILDKKNKQLRNRAIGLVKVQWTWYGPEDATWEHEDAMRAEYLHLFEDFENLADAV